MKTHALLFLALLLGLKAEEAAQCRVLLPGEAKTWEVSNTHKGKTRYARWGIDVVTMNEERIVENADGSVRGRVITTYKGGKPHVTLAFRGMAEAWFTERWTWNEDGSRVIETRKINGELIVKTTFPAVEGEIVKSEDSSGKELSPELEKQMSEEVADKLF